VAAHPELIRATVLSSLVATPDHVKRRLFSRDEVKRAKAQDSIGAGIVLAITQIS
jgi:hypothetical protein